MRSNFFVGSPFDLETEDWCLSAEEDGGQGCDSLMCMKFPFPVIECSGATQIWWLHPLWILRTAHFIDGEN